MTLQNKLTQLSTALTSLKTKIQTKMQTLNQQITSANQSLNQKTTQLNEVNHKLELSAKGTAESEKVLDQLLKEMQNLEQSL